MVPVQQSLKHHYLTGPGNLVILQNHHFQVRSQEGAQAQKCQKQPSGHCAERTHQNPWALAWWEKKLEDVEEADVGDREVPWMGIGNVLCSQLCSRLSVWPWISPFISLSGLEKSDPSDASDPLSLCTNLWLHVGYMIQHLNVNYSSNALIHQKEHGSLFLSGNWQPFLPALLFQPHALHLLPSLLIKSNCSQCKCSCFSPKPFQEGFWSSFSHSAQ